MGLDLLQERIDKAERDAVSDKRLANYRAAFRLYEEWLKTKRLKASAVTPRMFETFVLWLSGRVKRSTVQTYLSCIRSAYRLAEYDGIPNPTRTYRLGKAVDTAPRVYTHKELAALRDACRDSRDVATFMLLAWTGLRKDEARNVRWDDVDLEGRMLTVVGKNGKLRHVPIHAALLRYLSGLERRHEYVIHGTSHMQTSGTPVSDSTLSRIIADMHDRAGVAGSAHAFRRTVATSLSRDTDARESTIDTIMGWAPATVKSRYYVDVPTKAMHDAMADLHTGFAPTNALAA